MNDSAEFSWRSLVSRRFIEPWALDARGRRHHTVHLVTSWDGPRRCVENFAPMPTARPDCRVQIASGGAQVSHELG